MDKDSKDQSPRYKRPEGSRPNGHKEFPNYLIQRPAMQNQEERNHSGTFNGKEARTSNSHVPFLERKPKAPRQSHQAAEGAKSRVAQRQVPSAKEEDRTRTSLPVFAQHKARRPFRPTRLPSTWRKREEEEEKEYDFSLLKKELRIAEKDLILLDLAPLAEEEKADRTSSKDRLPNPTASSRTRPNRALHRSLSGIMEQESVRESRKRDGLRLKRRNYNGYSSYFD